MGRINNYRSRWGRAKDFNSSISIGYRLRMARLSFRGNKRSSKLPSYVERYLAGEFALNDFISYTMPIESINRAFYLMHSGESILTVVSFK